MNNPNVLLVVLDSVRARNTSLHGHVAETTPFLNRFAEQSEVYKQARAPSIHSVASHASIFTGYHVPVHGITKHESKLDPTSTIWYELSDEYGYETGVFTPNVVLAVSSNLVEPFETVDGPRQDPGHRYFEAGIAPSDIEGHQTKREYLHRCLNSSAPIRSIVNGLYFQYYDSGRATVDESAWTYIDSFFDWIDALDNQWAACLNLMDAHYPYKPVNKFDLWGGEELQTLHDSLTTPPSREIATKGDWWKLRAIESLYDGCIRQIDNALEYLVSELKERNEFDETLLIITSDHGEGFGEASLVAPDVRIADHSWGLHEVQTHVPLIVNHPRSSEKRTEDRLASLTEFPEVVRNEILGQQGSFVVDEYTISVTYRIEHPERILPDECEDRDKYRGPWKALYRQSGGNVERISQKGSKTYTGIIENAQIAYPREIDDISEFHSIFENLENRRVGIDEGDSSIDDSIERQLEELGYLR